MEDYYDVLRIEQDASPSKVRSAYLALMKRHHPDRAGKDIPADAPSAASINVAYWWLGDAGRRARYDQAKRSAALTPFAYTYERVTLAPVLALPRERAIARDGAPRRWAARLAFVLIVTASAGAWFAFGRVEEAPPPSPSGEEAGSVARLTEPTSADRLVAHEAMIDRDWTLLEGGTDALERKSGLCFAALAAKGSATQLRFCAALDAVAAQALGSRSAYFANAARRARLFAAAPTSGLDPTTLWTVTESAARAVCAEDKAAMPRVASRPPPSLAPEPARATDAEDGFRVSD